MRFAAIPLALLLAIPAVAGGQSRGRPPPPSTQSPAPAPSVRAEPAAVQPPPTRPPPPASDGSRPPPPASTRPPPPGGPAGPGGPWAPPPPVYYPPPFWWGFGWGYGYYPLYPSYVAVVPGYAPVPATPPQATAAVVRAAGAFGSGDSSAVGMAFAVDGPRAGFDLSFDAFAPTQGGVMVGGLDGPMDAYAFSTAHFAYPVLDGPSFRLRLQAGGSWLSVPTSTSGGSNDAFGFDLGVSANVGLIGPLGVEGHAHFTPYPVPVIDLRAAAAIRAGAFALTGGWRVIDVAADSRTGPAARFEGPELGLGLMF